MEMMIGSIIPWGPSFAPRGFLACNGQLLPIRQYTALYSLLGVTYGGDGTTTFALPNLNGRVAVGAGQPPGLGNYPLGDTGGVSAVAIDQNTMAAHGHPVQLTGQVSIQCNQAAGNQQFPTNNYPAAAIEDPSTLSPVDTPYHTTANATAGAVTTTLTPTVQPAGSGMAHDNMQPYLGLYWIICIEGIFPQRP